jgi:hypothetical protein
MINGCNAMKLQYDDITPDHECAVCHKACGHGFTATCDVQTGVVRRVVCDECRRDELFRLYRDTGCITSSLMMEASLRYCRGVELGKMFDGPAGRWDTICKIHDSIVRIQYMVERFQKLVWFDGLQRIVRRSSTFGLSSQKKFHTAVGLARMLVGSTAGRALMTIETDDASVTVIADETAAPGESKMGIQGISATEDQAMEILMGTTTAWAANEIQMQQDGEVGLGC